MRSKSQKSIFNLLTAVGHKAIVIIVGLILPKLFIMSYGSELNGLRDSVRQIFAYIALLESGIGAATLQALYRPVAQEDHETTNAYLSAASRYYNRIGVLYFGILAAFGVFYAWTVSVESVTRIEVFAYFLVSGALSGINFFYLAKLKLLISAEGDQYIVSMITMVTYLAASAAKIILIWCNVHIILVESVFLCINLVATGVYSVIAGKKYPWMSFKQKPDYTCVQQKGSVMLHRVASVIFQNTDVVLLTFFCDLQTVSIYSMYKMVVNMVTSVIGELGNSVHFMFGQTFNAEQKGKEKFCRMIDVFNVYYSAIAFALYTVCYILILPFLRLYTAGMDINYIYPLLPVFYIVMEFLMVGREAMMRTIEVAGHFKKTQWRSVTEAVINLTASIIFVWIGKHFWGNIGGIYGVLAGTIAALLYRTIDINLYANRQILHRSAGKTFAVMFTNLLLFAVSLCMMHWVQPEIRGYVGFVLCGAGITAVLLVLFTGVQSALHAEERRLVCGYIKAKMKKKHQ